MKKNRFLAIAAILLAVFSATLSPSAARASFIRQLADCNTADGQFRATVQDETAYVGTADGIIGEHSITAAIRNADGKIVAYYAPVIAETNAPSNGAASYEDRGGSGAGFSLRDVSAGPLARHELKAVWQGEDEIGFIYDQNMICRVFGGILLAPK